MPRLSSPEKRAHLRRLKKAPPPVEHDTSPVTYEEMERELHEQVLQRARLVRTAVNSDNTVSAAKHERKRLIFSEILNAIQRQHQGATPNGET